MSRKTSERVSNASTGTLKCTSLTWRFHISEADNDWIECVSKVAHLESNERHIELVVSDEVSHGGTIRTRPSDGSR